MTKVTIEILAAAAAAAALVIFLLVRHFRKPKPISVDEMEGHDFEYYCADLLRANGYDHVEVTQGSGDFGADILAMQGDVTLAVQCKCWDGPVGVSAVQEVYAAKDFYGCMAAIVMTNQFFTGPAREMADRLHVILWDRSALDALAEGAGEDDN